MTEPERAILHVDMDAFYASVEQRDNPELRGKPVIVGGTGNRGVVAAASYEVRKFGVRSAMPVREALRRCPDAICVRPRGKIYSAVSKQVFEVFREFTPLVEGLSLDEAFLDISGSTELLGDPGRIAREIKRRIRDRTKLTASVGIGPNKLVAKIASDLDKPDGLCWLKPDTMRARLDPLPAGRIPGIGPKTVHSLLKRGIRTIGDLRTATETELRPVFGRYTERMQRRAAGIDDREVVAHSADKSISAEETFDTDLTDEREIGRHITDLGDRVSARLRKKHLVAGVVIVKIRHADFTTCTRQQVAKPPTAETANIVSHALELYREWRAQNPHIAVRLLGVGTSRLTEAQQMSLFAGTEEDGERLDAALDEIRERFGPDSLKRGSGLS